MRATPLACATLPIAAVRKPVLSFKHRHAVITSAMGKKIAVVATSAAELAGEPTGCWAEEIMAPILMFNAAGHQVEVMTIAGGKVPIDETSMNAPFRTPEIDEFLGGDATKGLLDDTTSIANVSPESFDAVFLPGGHGVVVDMPQNEPLQKFVAAIYDSGNVVGSVCHGPACFANVKLASGEYLVAGKKVTGFSNSEEEAVGKTAVVPFLLEDKLKELGGKYCKSEEDWAPYVVEDTRLVTGQNPGSSKAVAEKMIQALA